MVIINEQGIEQRGLVPKLFSIFCSPSSSFQKTFAFRVPVPKRYPKSYSQMLSHNEVC